MALPDKKNIKYIFDQRAERPAHLERLLTRLETTEIDAIPYAERSKAIQHLTTTIFSEAANGSFWYKDPDFGSQRLIEEAFQREVDQIVRLLDSLSLSESAKEWVATRSIELALELEKATPYSEMSAQWPSLPPLEKIDVLKDIIRLQARVFEKGAIAFMPAPLKSHNRPGLAGFLMPKAIDLDTKHISPVHISENRLSHGSFKNCAITAIHEQLHSMFAQFAIAAHHSWMPPSHPLAEDAQKLLARHKYLGMGHFMINSAYLNDPEEKLAYMGQYLFEDYYAGKSPEAGTAPSGFWNNIKNFARKLGL